MEEESNDIKAAKVALQKCVVTTLLSDLVIIEKIDQDDIDKSGIKIPASSENTQRFGKIIQAGIGCKHCKAGDNVIWRRDAGDELIFDGKIYRVMREYPDVIAII